MTGNIINVNGDDHRRLRNLVNPALAPRAADRHRPAMRGFLEELLAARPRGRALRVRGRVRQALSVADHRPRARRTAGGRAAPAPLVQLDPAPVRRGLADERTRADRAKPASRPTLTWTSCWPPAPDLAGRGRHLGAPGRRGRGGPALAPRRSWTSCWTSSSAGSTRPEPAVARRAPLAEHPDQWAALRERPDELAGAGRGGGAALRAGDAVHCADRHRGVEYRDVTFPPGTIVMVSAWHANRGGESDPDAFDITAERSGRILTFGAGIHYCVGANLARAELRRAWLPGPQRRARRARRRARVRHDHRDLRARLAAGALRAGLSLNA